LIAAHEFLPEAHHVGLTEWSQATIGGKIDLKLMKHLMAGYVISYIQISRWKI